MKQFLKRRQKRLLKARKKKTPACDETETWKISARRQEDAAGRFCLRQHKAEAGCPGEGEIFPESCPAGTGFLRLRDYLKRFDNCTCFFYNLIRDDLRVSMPFRYE